MSDDDLIRDAVHELVGAAPPPPPLPSGAAPSHRSYRWLAVAAAAVLLGGGIVAVAVIRSGDHDASVATTAPPPVSTAAVPPTSARVSLPVSAPSTSQQPVPTSTSTTTTSTTTTTTTVAPTSTTVPLSPEAAVLADYLTALAEGRYADAAVLLNDGALEPERRSDLRPLFDEFGDVDDLAARLESWCGLAMCTQPDTPPTDIGGYWVATWTTPEGVLTGYFRSGSFEGVANVRGLPPRRASGSVVTCPVDQVVVVREADIDGDGSPDTVVVTQDAADGRHWVWSCNTGLELPPLEQPGSSTVYGVLAPAGEPGATLLIGRFTEEHSCGSTFRMAQSAGALVEAGWNGCWGVNTGESIGCRDIGGVQTIVAYRSHFLDGDRLDDSSGMSGSVLSLAGEILDSFTLTFPGQIEDGYRIIEPHCNGLPVVTEG